MARIVKRAWADLQPAEHREPFPFVKIVLIDRRAARGRENVIIGPGRVVRNPFGANIE